MKSALHALARAGEASREALQVWLVVEDEDDAVGALVPGEPLDGRHGLLGRQRHGVDVERIGVLEALVSRREHPELGIRRRQLDAGRQLRCRRLSAARPPDTVAKHQLLPFTRVACMQASNSAGSLTSTTPSSAGKGSEMRRRRRPGRRSAPRPRPPPDGGEAAL